MSRREAASEKGEAAVDLTRRLAFPHWHAVTLRFADEDRFGHLNNAVFATLCESGRAAYIRTLDDDLGAARGANALRFVIARLVLDFLAEAHYPGTVEIGTRALRIGAKSVTLGQGLFKDEACIATARSVLVRYDLERRAALPLEPALKARLARDIG